MSVISLIPDAAAALTAGFAGFMVNAGAVRVSDFRPAGSSAFPKAGPAADGSARGVGDGRFAASAGSGADPAQQEKARAPGGLLHGLTVLIVDDNETNIFVLKAFLTAYQPKEILAARCGREALDVLSMRDCDLIFMDIQMPGLDGVMATELIRKSTNERLAQLPVIAVTAACHVFNADNAAAAGMDGYIEKPVTWKLLQTQIVKALTRRNGSGA